MCVLHAIRAILDCFHSHFQAEDFPSFLLLALFLGHGNWPEEAPCILPITCTSPLFNFFSEEAGALLPNNTPYFPHSNPKVFFKSVFLKDKTQYWGMEMSPNNGKTALEIEDVGKEMSTHPIKVPFHYALEKKNTSGKNWDIGC